MKLAIVRWHHVFSAMVDISSSIFLTRPPTPISSSPHGVLVRTEQANHFFDLIPIHSLPKDRPAAAEHAVHAAVAPTHNSSVALVRIALSAHPLC